jgi:hypothetical protein
MSRGTARSSTVVWFVLAALSAIALAACGSDEAQELTLELGENGKITVPATAESGLAEISLENTSDERGEAQLVRVDGDHSPEEVLDALKAAMGGKPLPDWFFAGGGVAPTKPGQSATITQVLEPGTYYAFNTESPDLPDATAIPAMEVTGDESDEELEADSTVEAAEYAFTADGLEAGENEIDFVNNGAQPHHLIVAPIKGDATIADVEKAIKTEKGPPPIEDKRVVSTSVIEGGESQLVSMNLKPGRYAMMCFVTDRQGGPPHALKGMVDELEIE